MSEDTQAAGKPFSLRIGSENAVSGTHDLQAAMSRQVMSFTVSEPTYTLDPKAMPFASAEEFLAARAVKTASGSYKYEVDPEYRALVDSRNAVSAYNTAHPWTGAIGTTAPEFLDEVEQRANAPVPTVFRDGVTFRGSTK